MYHIIKEHVEIKIDFSTTKNPPYILLNRINVGQSTIAIQQKILLFSTYEAFDKENAETRNYEAVL
jgi:hypothetical protein